MVECNGFYPQGYYVPAFQLPKGHFLRLWIEIQSGSNPHTTSKYNDRFKLCKKLPQYLSGQKKKREITLATPFNIIEKIHENFFRKSFFPQTVREYLNKIGLNDPKKIAEITHLKINPEVKLKLLSSRDLQLLEIYIGFQKYDNILFDYFHLGPEEEKRLTSFVKEQLHLGKTVIALDNLDFISDTDPDPRIIKLKINRT